MDSKTKTQNARWFILVMFALTMSYGLGVLSAKFIELRENASVANSGKLLGVDALDGNYIGAVLEAISKDYLGELPEGQELTYGALRGIVDSFDDRYTSFLDPQATKDYFASASSAFEGVGITLAREDNYTIVETVLDDHPAQKGGVKSGDVITEVDGKPMIDKSPEEVASVIRGEAGSQVQLLVYRESQNKTLEFKLTRAKIDLDNIDWEMLEDKDIAHIKIFRFSEDTVDAFLKNWDQTVSEVKAANPKGIVIDLRNNPGGYVAAVQYVAEEFLGENKVIFKEQTNSDSQLTTIDRRKGAFESIPVVVLVNEGSASSSEILAAALQDNDRAEIIGQPTVGKGVEQKLIQMNDGSMLILVFRKWLTPNGVNISEEKPITPDMLIQNEDKDSQLEKALETLTK